MLAKLLNKKILLILAGLLTALAAVVQSLRKLRRKHADATRTDFI
jgi:hypothetical protein